VGASLSAAIVPAGQGLSWQNTSTSFPERLSQLDLLLHGYSHRRPASLSCVSFASGRSDELVGLALMEIDRRLACGQQIMSDCFGRKAGGFLPPAWRTGALQLSALASSQMAFLVGYRAATRVDGLRIPLATSSWDWGPSRAMAPIASLLSRASFALPGAVPVIALHPCDERRGALSRALDRIRRLLDQGLAPTTFSRLMGEHS
jgi:peptidoglycan/xylan/chitin deacetylase (PgdA/CDA1 family)